MQAVAPEVETGDAAEHVEADEEDNAMEADGAASKAEEVAEQSFEELTDEGADEAEEEPEEEPSDVEAATPSEV
jgi:hypothetical protein